MGEAIERESRRWWLLWIRRHTPAPPTPSAERIMQAVAREGQLGERPAAYYLDDPRKSL